ncbi:MAG: CopG family transcriptional regulator [Nanoarchaeota archaeon]|nr:CopG family transcriptional regulator [Nanoarchaeota archaeon]
MAKRVSISLDKEQVQLINSVKGFGSKEAEKVKNILMAYLSEKGYLGEFNKNKRSN